MRCLGSPEPAGPDPPCRRHRIARVTEDPVRRNSYAPSGLETAGTACLTGMSSVARQLSMPEEEGLVSRGTRRPRAIMLRPRHDPAIQGRTGQRRRRAAGQAPARQPLAAARIAAGGPSARPGRPGTSFPCQGSWPGRASSSCSAPSGDSVTGAAITVGDRAAARREASAGNGDIVVALPERGTSAEGERTVKTFRKRNRQAWLILHHPAHTPATRPSPGRRGRCAPPGLRSLALRAAGMCEQACRAHPSPWPPESRAFSQPSSSSHAAARRALGTGPSSSSSDLRS